MKYCTKSITVEAVQWTGENVDEIVELLDINPTKLHFGWFVTAPSNISEVPTVSLIDDDTFQLNYEPLPEFTLDLEAIEARLQAVVDCSHDDWKRNLEWGAQYAIDDMTALIAEVKRLRRG